MASDEKIKQAFGKVKEDVEGVKDEMAFVLKRVANIESLLIKRQIQGQSSSEKRSKKRKK